MSHTLTVQPVKASPQWDRIVELTELDGISLIEEGAQVGDDGEWPQGTAYVYREGVSVRPLEVTFEGDSIDIRIFTASEPETYELAAGLADAIARDQDAQILPEDAEEPLSVEEFEDYAAERLDEICQVTTDMTFGMVKERGAEVTLAGVHRPMVLGPRTLALLPTKPEARREAFWARGRRLQYIQEEDVFLASTLVLGGDKGEEIKLATFAGVPTVISAEAQYVTMPAGGDEHLQVPFEAFVTVVGERGEWLDDGHFFVHEIDSDAIMRPEEGPWPEFLDAIRPHAVDELVGERKRKSGCGCCLGLIALLVLLIVLGRSACSGPLPPGEAGLRKATSAISVTKGEVGLGNSAAAKALAKAFSERFRAQREARFSAGKPGASAPAEGAFLTWCELGEKRVAFLVHVPQFKRFKDEVRSALLLLAWEVARAVTAELRGAGEGWSIGIGLRGALLYGAIATGADGDRPTHVETGFAVSTKTLRPFFIDVERAR